MSVKRFIDDPMIHQSRSLMHRPGTVWSQRLLSGIQAKQIETTCDIPKATIKIKKVLHNF